MKESSRCSTNGFLTLFASSKQNLSNEHGSLKNVRHSLMLSFIKFHGIGPRFNIKAKVFLWILHFNYIEGVDYLFDEEALKMWQQKLLNFTRFFKEESVRCKMSG
jgi:hypothetical protein